MTTIAIDPNIRVRGNQTYAGLEDATGMVMIGQVVEVLEVESGLTGKAMVTDIDDDARLVYLAVDWASLSMDWFTFTPTLPGQVTLSKAS